MDDILTKYEYPQTGCFADALVVGDIIDDERLAGWPYTITKIDCFRIDQVSPALFIWGESGHRNLPNTGSTPVVRVKVENRDHHEWRDFYYIADHEVIIRNPDWKGD